MGHRQVGLLGFASAALALCVAPVVADTYTLGLMTRAFCFAMLALSVDLLWGYTGILSLGQSAFFGTGAYAIGVLFSHITTAWWAAPVGLLAGIFCAVVLATVVGWFTFYSRISLSFPFYVSVVTLALAVVFNQVVLSGGKFTGASQGLSGFTSLQLPQAAWYWISLVLLAGFVFTAYIFVWSDAGRVLVAIRENEERCRYLGIDTPKVKVLLFAVCAGVAAAAGAVYAAFTTLVAPSLVGFTLATDAVIWTALGGRGTLFGPVAGAGLINVIGPALNARFPFIWQLFLGLLFVVVVAFMPRGLLPVLIRPGMMLLELAGGNFVGTRRTTVVTPSLRRVDLPLSSNPGRSIGYESTLDAPALKITGVSKNFGSLRALKNVSLEARRGELLSIVGPNGAGKTTLIRCIADGLERSDGDILVLGHALGHAPPHRIVAFGLGRKFQAANVFDSLTVGESLRLASWRGRIPSVTRSSKELSLPPTSIRVIEMTGLARRLDDPVRSLSHGSKQSLELAMVLALEPTVLLLDEPTAGLNKEERAAVARLLAELRDSHELCILLIEHDFEFVKQISNRMIVLHEGEVILDGSVKDVAESPIVRAIYLGQRKAVA
jgi:branched-chain amino acid transport system permease protein